MQQKKLKEISIVLNRAKNLTGSFCLGITGMVALCGISAFSYAADLLADEQGPTAPEAVIAQTAGDDFLLPSYTVPAAPSWQQEPVPSEVDILNEIFGPSSTALSSQPIEKKPATQRTFSPQKGLQRADTPLLTPLAPLPVAPAEFEIEPKKAYFPRAGYADQFLATAASANTALSMPREIRITFYPNQATFSAQALKWVKSFATRVVNDPRLLAEIRISNENEAIQQKRLRLLLQVLKESGVSRHQIRLYKTNREADSVLIGYAQNPSYTAIKPGVNSKERIQKTIDW